MRIPLGKQPRNAVTELSNRFVPHSVAGHAAARGIGALARGNDLHTCVGRHVTLHVRRCYTRGSTNEPCREAMTDSSLSFGYIACSHCLRYVVPKGQKRNLSG